MMKEFNGICSDESRGCHFHLEGSFFLNRDMIEKTQGRFKIKEHKINDTHPAAPVTIAFLFCSLPIRRLFRVCSPLLLVGAGAAMI